jgi:hypothetical protein
VRAVRKNKYYALCLCLSECVCVCVFCTHKYILCFVSVCVSLLYAFRHIMLSVSVCQCVCGCLYADRHIMLLLFTIIIIRNRQMCFLCLCYEDVGTSVCPDK